MNTCNGCRWPFTAGLAAMGILGLGVGVQAQPPELFDATTGQPIPGSRGMIEAVPEGVPEVVIFSVQSPEGSAATGGVAEALVYQAIDFNPVAHALFLNYGPSTGATFPGTMMADNLGMSREFQGQITSYDLKVYRSILDPQPGLADFHVELWDGDPFCFVDTEFGSGPGGCGQPIPGTEADFVDIPVPPPTPDGSPVLTLTAVLPAKVTGAPERMWMVISGSEMANPSPCRLGWLFGLIKPVVGTDEFDDPFGLNGNLAELQIDDDGLGACCADGSACDVAGGTPCAGDDTGSRGFCSDGDAETASIFNFGPNLCLGTPDDVCAVFVASVFAPTDTTISLIPVSVDAPPSSGSAAGVISLSGNEVVLQDGDHRVFLEVRIGDWDPDDTGVQVAAYQAQLNATDGFVSGLQGSLTYPLVACAGDADCEAELGTGAVCEPAGFETPPGSCSRGYIDANRFEGECDAASPNPGLFCVVDFKCIPGTCKQTGGFVMGSVTNIPAAGQGFDVFWAAAGHVVQSADDPVPFPAEGLYGGSMAVEVPADARGTFTLDFFPNSSFLVDQNIQFIPLIGLVPGKITVQVGQCCLDICGADPGCIDDVTADECAAQPGVTNFDPGKTCEDSCPACTGACCDRRIADPALRCLDDVFESECVIDDPTQVTWSRFTRCSEIECLEHTGACCVEGVCTDEVPQSECESDKWFKATPCDDPDVVAVCEPQRPIPTVSAWGLIIMTLLLLTGGKIYFGRREAVTFPIPSKGCGHDSEA